MRQSKLLISIAGAVATYQPINNCWVDHYGMVEVEHLTTHYFDGGPYRINSTYGECFNGTLTCYLDNNLEDRPVTLPRIQVDCGGEAHASRRLGVAEVADKVWPLNTLCYTVSGAFTNSELNNIGKAITAILNDTESIRILTRAECNQQTQKPCNNCNAYVDVINNESGCYSNLGYLGNRQVLNLAEGCFRVGAGTVIHEFGHALGLRHEHTHPNRTISAGLVALRDGLSVAAKNYEIETNDYVRASVYDPLSIMHYGLGPGLCFVKDEYLDTTFCDVMENSNDGCTIPVELHCNRTKEIDLVGQRTALSDIDKITLNAMYLPLTN